MWSAFGGLFATDSSVPPAAKRLESKLPRITQMNTDEYKLFLGTSEKLLAVLKVIPKKEIEAKASV